MTGRLDIDLTCVEDAQFLASFLYKYPRRRIPPSKPVVRLNNCLDRADKLMHAVEAGIADDRERRCTSFCIQNGVFPFLKGISL